MPTTGGSTGSRPSTRDLGMSVLRGLGTVSGWSTLQDVGGIARGLLRTGGKITGLELSPSGSIVARSPNITDPETYGSTILLPESATANDLAHEQRHSDQALALGPAFIPTAAAEGMQEYGRGPLERDAYRQTEPTTEFLRSEPNRYTRAVEGTVASVLGGRRPGEDERLRTRFAPRQLPPQAQALGGR